VQKRERSYVNGGSKVLRRSRFACGHSSRFAPLALFQRRLCGEDGVEGWRRGEKYHFYNFFLIFSASYNSVVIRTKAIMMGYTLVENRGRKMILFSLAAYMPWVLIRCQITKITTIESLSW